MNTRVHKNKSNANIGYVERVANLGWEEMSEVEFRLL